MVCFIAAFAAPASALPLVNGDFDDTIGLTGTQWSVFNSIPGWTKVDGTSGIEVQRNTIVPAHSGDQYVELDSYSNSGMYQDLYLTSGMYELSFYYQPRTGTDNDNGIDYGITGVFNGNVDGTNPPLDSWMQVTKTFEITADDTYELWFSAVGIDNSLGGFVDTVNVDPVPEPSTLLLMGFGILGLVGIRKKMTMK
jgi:hypothetical protein